MDETIIIIFFGFILVGIIIGWAVGFALGQRHILQQISRERVKRVNTDHSRRQL